MTRGAPRSGTSSMHEAPRRVEQQAQEGLFRPAQANTAIELGLRTGFDSGAVFLGDRFETRQSPSGTITGAGRLVANLRAPPLARPRR
jgi:hypothetical protein